VNEGLPSSESYFVHFDRSGYLWVCTDRGVVRYDGFKFELFTTANGLPDNVVFYVVEDKQGRIWFVGNSGKLSYYHQGKIHLYQYNHKIYGTLKINPRPAKKLSFDQKGNLIFSNNYNGIVRISKQGEIQHWYKNIDHHQVIEIAGAFHPLFANIAPTVDATFPNGRGKSVQIHSAFPDISLQLSEIRIGHRLFGRFKNEIFEINAPTKNKCLFENVIGMDEVNGYLVICTLKGGFIFSKENNYDLSKPAHVFFKEHKVSSLTQDSEGGWWASTLDNGVYYMPNPALSNYKIGFRGGENEIFDVFPFRGELYYSNLNGYFKFNNGACIHRLFGPSTNFGVQFGDQLLIKNDLHFESLFKRVNHLTICSELESFSPGKNNSMLVSGFRLFRYYQDGTSETIYTYNPHKTQPGNIHLDQVAEDLKRNKIYAGNLLGLHRFNGKDFDQVNIPKELRNIRISALIYDPRFGLWVGTRGQGVYLLQDDKIVVHVTNENGLIDDQINSIALGSNQCIWVATNSGVSKVFIVSKTNYRIQNITKFTGLISSEINRVCEFGDSLYMATKSGISVLPINFNTKKAVNNRHVQLKEFRVNGVQSVPKEGVFLLNGYSDLIKIHLFSSNHRMSKNKKYRYRLNSSEDWTEGSYGVISFVNLEHGTYDLEISYLDENGVYVKPYRICTIVKSPKFIESNLFILLLIIGVLSGLGLLVFFRLRSIRARYRQLKLIEQLEQKSLIAQINPHFIFNSLNSIQSFLVYEENEKAEKYLVKLGKLIRSTLTVSRENKVSIQQEMVLLTQYLQLEQMRFKERFQFVIDSHLNTEEELSLIPPMLIQPFVENSVLHGFIDKHESGIIRIRFMAIEQGRLFVEIEDNGVGRKRIKTEENSGHRSFGTQITQERLQAFERRYKHQFYFEIIDLIENEQPVGTFVKLVIPIIK
jgi:two-component sensor histidine kinase